VARLEQLRLRFEQEALAMGQLSHPGAVEVRDIDVAEDGSPFLVMELLEGESLKERVKRVGSPPLEEILRYADEILDVLAAAHDKEIVHRDIKPDNLFVVASTGTLKVLDFGVARMREGAAKTAVGTRLGTLPYMPPEQVNGETIDGRADLFALGAVMFQLVARRRVHNAKTESEMIVKMSSEPAPSLGSVATTASHELSLVIDRSLCFDRERRYPDARTMQADVRALRAGQTPPEATRMLADFGPPTANTEMREPSTRRPVAAGDVAPAAQSMTSETRAAVVAVAGASPVGPTVAATPFDGAPVSSTMAAPPAPAGGHPPSAPGAVASPVGMPKTAAIPELLPGALADSTKVSVGVVPIAETTQVSAGAPALPPSQPVGPSDPGMASAAAAVSTSQPPSHDGAIGWPASAAASPSSVESGRRNRQLAAVILLVGGVLAACLFVGIWVAFGTSAASDETEEQDEERDSARAKRRSRSSSDASADGVTPASSGSPESPGSPAEKRSAAPPADPPGGSVRPLTPTATPSDTAPPEPITPPEAPDPPPDPTPKPATTPTPPPAVDPPPPPAVDPPPQSTGGKGKGHKGKGKGKGKDKDKDKKKKGKKKK